MLRRKMKNLITILVVTILALGLIASDQPPGESEPVPGIEEINAPPDLPMPPIPLGDYKITEIIDKDTFRLELLPSSRGYRYGFCEWTIVGDCYEGAGIPAPKVGDIYGVTAHGWLAGRDTATQKIEWQETESVRCYTHAVVLGLDTTPPPPPEKPCCTTCELRQGTKATKDTKNIVWVGNPIPFAVAPNLSWGTKINVTSPKVIYAAIFCNGVQTKPEGLKVYLGTKDVTARFGDGGGIFECLEIGVTCLPIKFIYPENGCDCQAGFDGCDP
jgi:hypothetical protein